MSKAINQNTDKAPEEASLFQERKRTFVSDIERGVYDIKDSIDYKYSTGLGLNEEVVKKISARKKEPDWMLDLRLKSLVYFNERPMPDWGADISDLDIVNWTKINALRWELMKDSVDKKCLFSRIKNVLLEKNYSYASDLQLEMDEKMALLKTLYTSYQKNIF